MIEPISLSFEVPCSADRAFAVWTGQISDWWPADHTVSGEADLTVILEGHPGGRIFERRASGVEHDWGAVTIWEPPHRLAYRWHLKVDPAEATEVEITFSALGNAVTRVDIEHRGWERVTVGGKERRDANRGGWRSLLPHYAEAVGHETLTVEEVGT